MSRYHHPLVTLLFLLRFLLLSCCALFFFSLSSFSQVIYLPYETSGMRGIISTLPNVFGCSSDRDADAGAATLAVRVSRLLLRCVAVGVGVVVGGVL